VSRALEGVLDVEDLIPYRYVLEVSSPGLNRPLRRKEDFVRFAGECVKIKTKEPIEGRSNYKGILNGMDGAEILVTVDGTPYRIPYDLLAKARIEPRFK
jgi:ribosome maturation factor RimP